MNIQCNSFRVLEIIFGVFLIMSIFFNTETFEQHFFPVVSDFNVNSIQKVEDGIEISGTMVKDRSCKFKELMVYIKDKGSSVSVPASFEFLDNSSSKDRAAIAQAWGPWKVFIPGKHSQLDIKMFSRHNCHSFYDTYGKLTEFSILESDEGMVINQ